MKFYLRILICLGMLGTASLHAQKLPWLWAKSGDGMKQDQSSSIAVDSAGEIFVTGYYQDSANFSGTIIRSSKGNHFFLAKYSADGSLAWVQTSRLTGHSAGTALSISRTFIYLAGYFSDSLEFPRTTLFSASGTSNLFLAKYDLQGNFQWAKGETASGADLRKAIVSDRDDNVFLCGSFSGNATFGGISLTSPGTTGIYLVKFDSNGSAAWAHGFGSRNSSNAGLGITLDHSKNLIITGSFGDTLDFGSASLIAEGALDIFIAKFDTSGKSLWARQAKAVDLAEGVGITTDKEDNIYATGSFSGNGTSTGCDGIGNIYIAKYSVEGVLQWMKCVGSRGEESGNAIASDSSGNIYVTGGCDNTIDFGSGEITTKGIIDAFIVKFNSSGAAQWSESIGGPGTDFGTSIALDPESNLCLTGIFSNTCVFGSVSLLSNGLTDIFTAKIAPQSGVSGSVEPKNNALLFYPNPVKENLNVEWNSDRKGGPVSIELFSLLGESMKKIFIPQNESQKQIFNVFMSDLPRGAYLCRIRSEGNTGSGMIVLSE